MNRALAFRLETKQPTRFDRLAQRVAAIASQQSAHLAMAGRKVPSRLRPAPTISGASVVWVNCINNTTSTGDISFIGSAVSSTTTGYVGRPVKYWSTYTDQDIIDEATRSAMAKVRDGQTFKLELPDGAVLDVKGDGSYEMVDAGAKVIYRAARFREFNRFINASDRIEEFIEFCGQHGVRQGEMLEIPLKLFIGWLVVEAAKADDEKASDTDLIDGIRRLRAPRCLCCTGPLSDRLRMRGIEFCGPGCFEDHYQAALPGPAMSLQAPQSVGNEVAA